MVHLFNTHLHIYSKHTTLAAAGVLCARCCALCTGGTPSYLKGSLSSQREEGQAKDARHRL